MTSDGVHTFGVLTAIRVLSNELKINVNSNQVALRGFASCLAPRSTHSGRHCPLGSSALILISPISSIMTFEPTI